MDYNRLMAETARLSQYIRTGSIGKSESGREIPYLFIGKMGVPQTVICGTVHAREYITTSLCMMILERNLLRRNELQIGVWFVPMVNPDGAELAMYGLRTVSDPARREFLVRINGGSEDFSQYKANIRGVDINNNFPARWGQDPAKSPSPAPSGYIGPYAGSEKETQALMTFTTSVKPSAAVAYHSKGEVIYWDFDLTGERKRQYRQKAEIISRSTGYPLVPNDASVGGYKDWCISALHIPAYTIEVGASSLPHPLGEESLNDIYLQNRYIVENLEEITR